MSFKNAPSTLNLTLNSEDRIAGVLAEGCAGEITARNRAQTFRRYATTVQTRTKINGRHDVAQKTIKVEIGARHAPGNGLPYVRAHQRVANDNADRARLEAAEATPPADEGVIAAEDRAEQLQFMNGYVPIRPSQSFQASSDFSQYFVGNARRFAGFSGAFLNCDFSALVERLAAAVAFYSHYGNLTNNMLRGGANRQPAIIALEMVNQAQLVGDDKIFVPTRASTPISPNTFAAIVYAATGCGATVITDVVNLDAQNNRVIVNNINGIGLVEGCYSALKLIGAQYVKNQRGDLFAYALTRGIHSEVTVVAHTDEGGYVRDVLRRDHFAIPHGGIDIGLDLFHGLPRAAAQNLLCYRQIVDSIAIATAGAVAVADPLITVDGRLYPTTVTSNTAVDNAEASPAENDLRARMAGLIANHCAGFCENYITALSYIFGVESNCTYHEGSVSRAATHMIGCFTSLAQVGTRHSNFTTLSPFFWIEPTGAVRFVCRDLPAFDAGYGPLAFARNDEMEYTAFEQIGNVHSDATRITADISWRSARTNALVIHLRAHPKDGMANFIPLSMDPNALINIGDSRAEVPAGETIYDRMNARDPLGNYLWEQGQSWLPAPGEMIYAGTGMKVQINHSAYNAANAIFELTHTPNVFELQQNLTVYMSVTPFIAIGVDNIGHEERCVRRARTRAAHSFTNALAMNEGSATMFHDQSIAFADVGFTDARIDERVAADTNEAYGQPVVRNSALPQNENRPRRFGVPDAVMIERPANGPYVNRAAMNQQNANAVGGNANGAHADGGVGEQPQGGAPHGNVNGGVGGNNGDGNVNGDGDGNNGNGEQGAGPQPAGQQ